MAETLTFEQLAAAAALETKTVDIPELGGAVTIRSLSRAECMAFAAQEAADAEAAAITLGMVEPAVSDEQARQLIAGKAGVGIKLARAILDLSGLGDSFRS